MKRATRLSLVVAVSAAATLWASALVSAATTTTGSWVAYPGQQTIYQTQIKKPINADGSSVFANDTTSVIPVQFGLLSGLGPFVFESIYADNTSINDGGGTCGTGSGADHANDCAFLSFTPSPAITFNQITMLKATYTFTLGDCHGGSLRWSVRTSSTQSVFIYYGGFPNFTDCTSTANNQSGVNMIGRSDLRYDTSQYAGGTFYDSYLHAQTLVGNDPIIRASLVLDSGWAGDQRLTLGSATVNDNTFTPPPPTALKSTCNLPPADIRVTKVSDNPPTLINEPVSIQPADTNGHFRIVDCKYIYNLAVSSLSGDGEYKVEVVINGNPVPPGAMFGLK